MLVLALLVFLAVSLAAAGLYLWLMPTKAAKRLKAISQQTPGQGHWTENAVQLVSPFARFSAPEGKWEESPLRLRFLNAGIYHESARVVFFGLKTLLPIVFVALLLVAAGFLGVVKDKTFLLECAVTALVACYLPNIALLWQIRRRKREIFEEFPDAADLMLVCVEAGLGLDACIERVTQEIRIKSKALADELHLMTLEMRVGGSREQALRHLALRTGLEEVSTFATMLTQADRLGTSIGDSLRVFSDDLRHKRQARAEEQAAKVPTKMLIPLVICVFPSIIMVIIGPAAIQIYRTILPMLTHGH